MTLTIDITPRLEAELARQAAVHGMPVDAYVVNLLEEAALPGSGHAVESRAAAIELLKTFGKTHGLSLGGIR